MASWLPSYEYRPLEDGYWGNKTSTINWCEKDYYVTKYSAEIVNAFTNLLFLSLGVKGVLNCLKYGHDRVFLVSFLGYLLVGSGSFLFHSTLKYSMQLIDELSMIYTTCIMCYACFSFAKSETFRRILAVSLLALAVFVTAYYHYLQDPSFHQNTYAIMTAVLLFRSMYVMEVNLRPSLRAKYGTIAIGAISEADLKAERAANAERDREILRTMWWMIGIGLSVFLGGFGVWHLDNQYCSTFRQWRRAVGLPWGILLEGHGYWHLMTGLGAYYCIVWAIWLRHCLNERQTVFTLWWPSIFSIPEVVSRQDLKSLASTNGHVVTKSALLRCNTEEPTSSNAVNEHVIRASTEEVKMDGYANGIKGDCHTNGNGHAPQKDKS